MTLDEAILTSAKAVLNAPRNMGTKKFWQTVPSLIIEKEPNVFGVMTVNEWREDSSEPIIKLVIEPEETFGG